MMFQAYEIGMAYPMPSTCSFESFADTIPITSPVAFSGASKHLGGGEAKMKHRGTTDFKSLPFLPDNIGFLLPVYFVRYQHYLFSVRKNNL